MVEVFVERIALVGKPVIFGNDLHDLGDFVTVPAGQTLRLKMNIVILTLRCLISAVHMARLQEYVIAGFEDITTVIFLKIHLS